MTACKHANGRDYWLVIGGHYTNTYYKFLIRPDSILGPFIQSIGPVYDTIYDWAYSKFSQDGRKFVTSCVVGLILVMDFDRCSGEFSSPITLYHYAGLENNQPVSGAIAEFSPDGRFVYATNGRDLSQYDLLSDTIQDSIQIWNDSSADFFEMNMLQIAPNGKIYGSTYNGGLDSLRVINYPDLRGDSCEFVFNGQPTLTLNSDVLPNMINYNLGPLGSITNAIICHGSTYTFNGSAYANAGVYYDTLTSAGGCDSILTLHLAIFPFSQPQITLTGKDTLSTTNFNHYEWLKDGQPIKGDTIYSYIVADTGNYSVIITDSNGCFDTSAVFDLNTLGITKQAISHLHITPNPADKYLYAEMSVQGNYEFDLLNELGQLIAKKQTVQIDIFDIESLASGIYFLKVTSKNTTNILTQKVVVQH